MDNSTEKTIDSLVRKTIQLEKENELLRKQTKNMNEKYVEQYYTMLEKFVKDEINQQQWYDYCTVVLGELMEEHKDVFVRLKNR